MSAMPEEQPAEQNPHALTAHEQGSEIPLGWKPTAAEPVPVVRCVQIKSDGYRCKNWSIRGYTKCRKHSGPGSLMKNGNVAKYAESIIEAARLRLVDSADLALDTLDQLIMPGSSEGIRLKAATEVLDRAGIRGGFEVKVEAQITSSPAEAISERLAALADGAKHVEKMRERARKEAAEEAGIVDAELVEDEPDQETLF